jgi:putative transposase
MKNDPSLPQRAHPVHALNLERWNQPTVIFLTVCTKGHKSVLASDGMHRFLVEAWNGARQWVVGRYLIMPDHIHLFCSPAIHGTESVQQWTAFWKRLVSVRVPQHKPLWQRDCWDTQLRHVSHYDEKWQYVVMNPVRKNLIGKPGDWPFQGELHALRW